MHTRWLLRRSALHSQLFHLYERMTKRLCHAPDHVAAHATRLPRLIQGQISIFMLA